jgi:hypothetical protein
MANEIFTKNKSLSYFAALALVLSLGFIVAGNFISVIILAAVELAVSDVQANANLVTVPIACALIAAAFIMGEGRRVEAEANRKVAGMMRMLKSDNRLSDDEIDALYAGMRDLHDV